jgi:hypothetical protein
LAARYSANPKGILSRGTGVCQYATGWDDPADAAGYGFYVLTQDEFVRVLSPPSNIVSFGA